MKEYEIKEYCKATNCIYRMAIDDINVFDEKINKEEIEEIYCKACGVYKFTQWLKDNNYKIIKGEGNQ